MDSLCATPAISLDAFDAALHRIYSATDPETFPSIVMPLILELTGGEVVGLCANALLPGDPFIAIAFAGSNQGIRWQQVKGANYDDHPTARFTATAAPDRAIRLTDHFPSRQAIHATRHYQENLKPLGMEYEMTLLMDTVLSQRLGISVARSKKDFTSEEMDIFSRLGPHLKRAFHHAQTLAQLRAAVDGEKPQAASWREIDLTPRESEVLRWIATGRTNRAIAKLLDVSPATVKTHLEHIYQKLGVSNRAGAAAALRNLPKPAAA